MRLTLTREADYAVRAMVWLAQMASQHRNAEAAPRQKAAAIARATGIPPAFSARVLAQLQHRGFLRARAGRDGGYSLAQPVRNISLLEVIEAVEGPLLSQECLLRDSDCGTDGYCVLHDAWNAAQEALRTTLAQTSLIQATECSVTVARPK